MGGLTQKHLGKNSYPCWTLVKTLLFGASPTSGNLLSPPSHQAAVLWRTQTQPDTLLQIVLDSLVQSELLRRERWGVLLELHGSLPSSKIQPNVLIEFRAIGIISHYYFIVITITHKKKISWILRQNNCTKIKVTSSLSMSEIKLKFSHPKLLCALMFLWSLKMRKG